MAQEIHNRRDELANSVTHAAGLLLSIVAVGVLIVFALRSGTAWHIVSCSVYGATMVTLYGVSTLYHSVRRGRVKRTLRILDHISIYLLIAGTYTPFTLVTLGGTWGWTLFAVVWGLALVGVVFKVFHTGRYETISTATYLGMGWLAVVAVNPILERFPIGCVLWIVVGGLLYTVGVRFYLKDHLPYQHAIWHVAVLAGSTCHYFAVLFYVIPTFPIV